MIIPNEPIGNSSLESWCRRLLRWCRTLEVQSGVGYRVSKTSGGTILQIDALGGGTSSSLNMMTVRSYHQDATHGDYITCRPLGGASDGSQDINVAVEPQLQSSITGQTMPDSTVWAYTSYSQSLQSRTSTQTGGAGAVLYEYITPPFLTGDGVAVWDCDNTGVTVSGSTLTKIAITGRQWAAA